jgi:hypothetical protein
LINIVLVGGIYKLLILSLFIINMNEHIMKYLVTLDDYIFTKDEIINRNIDTFNFKEIISLLFHAIKNISEKKDMGSLVLSIPQSKDDVVDIKNGIDKWMLFYKDFEADLETQNTRRWPKLSYIRNDFRKRLEIFSSMHYHNSKNLLMLVLKLLYIETFKAKNLPANNDYHDVLNNIIHINDNHPANKISLPRLFEIFKLYMQHYIKIYNNEMMQEYSLGKSILAQI